MSLIPLKRLSETIVGIRIKSPSDMFTALSAAAPLGYSGEVHYDSNSNRWRVRLNRQELDQFAYIDDLIIIQSDNGVMVKPSDEAAALYTTVDESQRDDVFGSKSEITADEPVAAAIEPESSPSRTL